MAKINRSLLPIKAHYFFFMAAMGPILPQTNVFGKELGISPDVMGLITSVLPILYVLTKPAVGYLIDYFPNIRQGIFISIVTLMIICFGGLYFIPLVQSQQITHQKSYNLSKIQGICEYQLTTKNADVCLTDHKIVKCESDCIHNNSSYIGFISSKNSIGPLQLCIDSMYDSIFIENITCPTYKCIPVEKENTKLGSCFYTTLSFWSFVFLICLGTIGFNVSNCVSDAACFDVLGDKTMSYGAQRVWGTIGFGFTALLSGIFVHIYRTESSTGIKTLTPPLFIMLIFGIFDLISIKWLELPKFTTEGESIAIKVMDLLRKKEILVFLCFATLAGILDSFIIYYLFWYIEELAEETDYMDSIKLIEACVVASECLGGEILFFLLSGKILKRIGYVHCLSFCFFMYFIRLGLISLIPSPWWLVLIEFFMQGSSYALCYTCIVAYASAISPMGTQNTIQGLVAGMDDGAGFAIGSIIGGQMYRKLGGTMSFRVFAIGALVTCLTHIILRSTSTGTIRQKTSRKNVNTNENLRDEEKTSELILLQDKNKVKAVIIIET